LTAPAPTRNGATPTRPERSRRRVAYRGPFGWLPWELLAALVVREPITEGNVSQALDAPAISEWEHEVLLHAEQLVVVT